MNVAQAPGEVRVIPIDEVVPYWRNPRSATDSDIAKVMRSIEEYGYQAPIIVDADNVIVAGHTRYMACRRLGYTEVSVLTTDLDQHACKEYRIIDNRSAELTGWDRDKLLSELREFGSSGVLSAFFPEVDLNMETMNVEDLVRPVDLAPPKPPAAVPSRTVICPKCYHEFELAKEEK
jgi:hypothetical protein